MTNYSCTMKDLDAGIQAEADRLDAIEAGRKQVDLLRSLPLPHEVIAVLEECKEIVSVHTSAKVHLLDRITKILDDQEEWSKYSRP